MPLSEQTRAPSKKQVPQDYVVHRWDGFATAAGLWRDKVCFHDVVTHCVLHQQTTFGWTS
jgi:hypothetical protein